MTRYPALFQINTRVWLTELGRRLGRPATLDDIPDADLDRLASRRFDWIWFLSVWQTGPAGQRVSRRQPEWLAEFGDTLPDLREEDIAGSGFAITGYTVHRMLGGDAALARLRTRLQQRGMRLMLDFVPNHTGLDHGWVESHPEYFVTGTEPTESCPIHQRIFSSPFRALAALISPSRSAPAQETAAPQPPSRVAEASSAPQPPPQQQPDQPKKRGFWSKVFGTGNKK